MHLHLKPPTSTRMFLSLECDLRQLETEFCLRMEMQHTFNICIVPHRDLNAPHVHRMDTDKVVD